MRKARAGSKTGAARAAGGPELPRSPVRDEVVPFNRVRSRAAVALVRSKAGSAHAWCSSAADYSAVEAVRSDRREAFASTEGFSLTYLPFVARAVADALVELPLLNAAVVEEPPGSPIGLVANPEVNLGFAVDLDHQGLVVPVVRDIGRLKVTSIARAVHDLADRARAKRLQPDEVAGVTFTITNPGAAGTWLSVPIIHQPAVAILSTEGVRKRVVVREGSVSIRPIGNLGLSFDQRVISPAYAARFLDRVGEVLLTKDWAADPEDPTLASLTPHSCE